MKKNNILYGAVGLGVLFLVYKALKKRQTSKKTSENLNALTITNKPLTTDNYSKTEATAKALITVKDWIKTYDGLSNDVLNENSSNKIILENRLNELKAKTNPTTMDFTEIQLLTQKLSLEKDSLKDKILKLKNIEYEKVYSILKDLYSEYPKADVDKLMIGLPKVLSGMMVGDGYKYSSDIFDKLSIEDKLYLSDIDFFEKFRDAYNQKYRKSQFTNVNIT